MRKRAGTSVLESWYSHITFEDVIRLAGKDAALVGRVKKRISEASKATSERVFQKITAPAKGLPRIVDQPPLLYHVDKV